MGHFNKKKVIILSKTQKAYNLILGNKINELLTNFFCSCNF